MATATSKLQIIIDILMGQGADKLSDAERGLRNIQKAVKEYNAELKAATPQNIKFANEFKRIQQGVKDGTMSIDQARVAVDKLEKEMAEAAPAAQKTSSSIANIAKVVATGTAAFYGLQKAIQVTKKIWDFAKQGAELQMLENRFNRLSEEMGTTGDLMLNKLMPAMGYIVSEGEAMTGALDFMSLGLVKNEKDLIRLAAVSSQLQMPLNQLTLALTNMTTMRFDSLNMSADGFDQRLKKLKDSGMDAQAAFTEAFLQQAEEQVKRVGSSLDETTAAMMRFEASMRTAREEAAKFTADAIGKPLVQAEKEIRTQNILSEAIDRGIISRSEYNQMLADSTAGFLDLNVASEKYAVQIMNLRDAEDATSESHRIYTELMRGHNQLFQDGVVDLSQYAASQQHLNRILALFPDVLQSTGDEMENYEQGAYEAAQASGALAGAVDDVGDAADDSAGKISSLNTNLDGMVKGLQDKIAWFQSGGAELEAAFANIQTALDQGLDPEAGKQALTELQEKVIDVQLEAGLITTDQAVAEFEAMGYPIEEAKEKVDVLQSTIAALTGKTVYIDIVERYVTGKPLTITQPGRGTVSNTRIGGEIEGHSGLDLTVPSGYPNDSFGPIWAESGEHVSITPAGQKAGGGSVTYVYNITNENPETAAISNAIIMSQELDALREYL